MANETLCSPFKDNISANTTSRLIGTVASVTCRDGYKLEGSPVVICDFMGYWSDQPYCLSSGSNEQVLIIVICSIASAVALGVLLCALYMLLSNCRKERQAQVQKREIMDTLRELSIYHAVTQDCVGMPPVIYDNMSSTLRGRTSSSDEISEEYYSSECVDCMTVRKDTYPEVLAKVQFSGSSSKPTTPQTLTGSETDLATEKAFIY